MMDERQSFPSVRDAIEDSATAAGNMRLRSEAA
jgi:predicted XRE-type DNA-binding protein